MKLDNFFELSPEEKATSEMIYEGKIIKCLVAPYHTYAQLEKKIPYTKNTYLFPERELPVPQLKSLISMIVASKSKEEFRIITANQNIIMDMVGECVRVLTEHGEVVPCPIKTFMANIHDIRYKVLENPDHQKSDVEKSMGHKKATILIDRIEKAKTISREEFDTLIKEIDLIGEPIIEVKLKEMALEKRM